MRSRERERLEKALAIVRNPAPGVRLVSAGFVSRKTTTLDALLRAIWDMRAAGHTEAEIDEVIRKARSSPEKSVEGDAKR